jgi:S-DNA-T family DNA segregation ATPase FtsK/SpoIIIE
VDNLLTAGQSISILDQLHAKMEELGSREKVIIESRDRELKAIRRKCGLEHARLKEQAEAETQKGMEVLEEERLRLETRFDLRKARIDQAYEKAQVALQEIAEQARSQQKYENQKKLLQANRVHDTEVQSLDRSRKSYLGELSEETRRLEQLGGAAWKVYKGYKAFRKRLESEAKPSLDNESHSDVHALFKSLRSNLNDLESIVSFSVKNLLARLFSFVSVWVILVGVGVGAAIAFFVPQVSDTIGLSPEQTLMGFGGFGGLVVVSYGLGYLLAQGSVCSFVDLFVRSNGLVEQCQLAVDRTRDHRGSSAREAIQVIEDRLESEMNKTDAAATEEYKRGAKKLSNQRARLMTRHEKMAAAALSLLTDGKSAGSCGESISFNEELKKIHEHQQALQDDVTRRFDLEIKEIKSEWERFGHEWLSDLKASQNARRHLEETLHIASSEGWEAAESGEPSGSFAQLLIDWEQFLKSLPADSIMSLPSGESLRIPLTFKMPFGESVLFESEGSATHEVMEAINHTVLELLMTAPIGRLRFTLIDPLGLGKNFAGLMHLADYDEQLINRRIWTQSSQIDQCLRDLTEHMEKVTQMYLRNEYDTLAEYNQAAGNIAEKYHVLVVSDFPNGFSETAMRRLHSIAVGGARCGVFMLLHRDRRQALPDDSLIHDLREHCVWIQSQATGCRLGKHDWPGTQVDWVKRNESQDTINLIHQIGRASVDSNRVEVPFSQVIPKPEEIWTQDTSASLKVPIGRTGASKLQFLTLGKGTQQHALIAGKTGSGKSTLFHVIVTNLALWSSPDQVEFYLIDFKKGVEFKCYAAHQLPHARVVAIESDREFGLSVLERVDQELRRRGDLFREKGVQDLAGYRASADTLVMPRTLLMIDEFQEYFVEDDHVAQNAAVLLDRIVRQGRAFGIHVILGSQTLGGAYTLARTTFAQMAVRIALQCDEADSYLIMDEDNAAPRLLSRPGEGIYNNSNGVVEGNSPFQTVWLTDKERETHLKQIMALAQDRKVVKTAPVIFEGNAPADIRDNHELAIALSKDSLGDQEELQAWLGAPNSIKGPTSATFGARSGSNLLIVGQNEEMAFSMIMSSLISLAAQRSEDRAEFVILDAFPDHSAKREMMDQVIAMLPHRVRTLKEERLEEIMGCLGSEMDKRAEEGEINVEIYFLVVGLQRFKKLRPEDEFSFSSNDDEGGSKPGTVLDRIISEGSSVGIRVIATIDSYNSSQRFLNRKALSGFEMRVLFQMSANDSAAMIDHTKASQLGLHRALFYNERRGYMEVFRPYAMPDGAWLSGVHDHFKKSLSGVVPHVS